MKILYFYEYILEKKAFIKLLKNNEASEIESKIGLI